MERICFENIGLCVFIILLFVGSVSRRQDDNEKMRVQILGPPKTVFVTFVLYTKSPHLNVLIRKIFSVICLPVSNFNFCIILNGLQFVSHLFVITFELKLMKHGNNFAFNLILVLAILL